MSQRWQNILIQQESTIRNAMQIIDREALRVGLVVNSEKKLLGVITDGDVRRGILLGLSLEAPVTEVMNSKPKVASASSSKDDLLKLMERLDILSIPLLDEDGGVVGLQTLRESLMPVAYDNPVFIMAGGFGTRLRPLTDDCPKPMLKVGDKPMLETLILNFKKAGFHNFYISTHYLPSVIHDYFSDGSKYGVTITYVHEEKPLGTGGALGLLPDDLPDLPIILMNGDVLTSIDFTKMLEFHNEYDPAATMCVREYEYQVPYGVIEGDGHKIISMVEKPTQRFHINAGIYVVSQQMLKSVSENEEIDMPTLLERYIALGRDVLKFPVHEYWLDVGRMDDFNRAQIDFQALGF
ncbi:nucleotidyltransferase family protein [uncultured Paraglaciecola sp.]|uniref:nucleotidyltransferase family protein n=1 Tax=uncultured Paraglaciecola sp. TaxID=1765024 RepID=UPI0025E0E669|nr:nucleotidyltransferase family protein [uncultured Paraglaciecola sp.]